MSYILETSDGYIAEDKDGFIREGSSGDPCCCGNKYKIAYACRGGYMVTISSELADANPYFSYQYRCYHVNPTEHTGDTRPTIYNSNQITPYVSCEDCLACRNCGPNCVSRNALPKLIAWFQLDIKKYPAGSGPPTADDVRAINPFSPDTTNLSGGVHEIMDTSRPATYDTCNFNLFTMFRYWNTTTHSWGPFIPNSSGRSGSFSTTENKLIIGNVETENILQDDCDGYDAYRIRIIQYGADGGTCDLWQINRTGIRIINNVCQCDAEDCDNKDWAMDYAGGGESSLMSPESEVGI